MYKIWETSRNKLKKYSFSKLFLAFTVRISCSCDLKNLANSWPSASNFKSFSQSVESFFLTAGQNNFGNKILLFIWAPGLLKVYYCHSKTVTCKGSFNNYLDKKRGRRGSVESPRWVTWRRVLRYQAKCPQLAKLGKIWSTYVFVEWPLTTKMYTPKWLSSC